MQGGETKKKDGGEHIPRSLIFHSPLSLRLMEEQGFSQWREEWVVLVV